MFIIEPGGSSGDWKTSEGTSRRLCPESGAEAAGRERRAPGIASGLCPQRSSNIRRFHRLVFKNEIFTEKGSP